MSDVGSGYPATSLEGESEAKVLGPSDIVIAIMGVTGSGKSTFVSELIGDKALIGHSLHSETKMSCAYEFHRPGQSTIHIVDTPGFDDTHTSDADVLCDISAFMTRSYRSSVKLAGIIYLHRITDNRVTGSALRNLRMFKELCGPNAYRHVMLVTSMWDSLKERDKQKATGREEQLVGETGFWKDMYERGSSVRRWHAGTDSADKIIDDLLAARDPSGSVTLQIQTELVEEGKKLIRTSAGREVNREMDELRKKLDAERDAIKEEIRMAIEEGDKRLQEALVCKKEEFEERHRKAAASQQALTVGMEALMRENNEKHAEERKRLLQQIAKLQEKLGQDGDQPGLSDEQRRDRENARDEANAKDTKAGQEAKDTKAGQEAKDKIKVLLTLLRALAKIATGVSVVFGVVKFADEDEGSGEPDSGEAGSGEV